MYLTLVVEICFGEPSKLIVPHLTLFDVRGGVGDGSIADAKNMTILDKLFSSVFITKEPL